MARGYAGKFLEADLTAQKLQDITFTEDVLRQYIGGRALATKILWDALGAEWETIDPLGPENILLALTGPMTGYYPGARICLSGKSSLTNGIVGSTVAAEFPIDLKCACYDGVIVKGRASEPVYLYIEDNTAEIRSAKHLWGTEGKQTIKLINQEIRQDLA